MSKRHPDVSHVIFDMDGTVSWLRHGWPGLMLEVFRPYYPAAAGESEEDIRNLLMAEILSLNGKQSIFQMEAFCARVKARGANCPTPKELLEDYQSRLDRLIEQRSQKIFRRQSEPDEFVVFGARQFLEQLTQRRLKLILLSGTIEHRVRQEVELLGLKHYFGDRIYGGALDHSQFSKKLVIERLLREENISGRNLLSFGDGPVEIFETKAVGGRAIGVASDEELNGSGKCDPHKREQLVNAGADTVVADYREPESLF
jgi:phosphoglycolate phosphatase-like HAD superfamily hydrolase